MSTIDTFKYNYLANNPRDYCKKMRVVKKFINRAAKQFSMAIVETDDKMRRIRFRKVSRMERRIRDQSIRVARLMKNSQMIF